jgi:hypothetical protein
VLAKTGFLVVALALLKKLGIFLIVPFVWAWRKLRGRSEA